MKRREFITLLGAAAAWPLAARAQQPGKLPKIGFLGSGSASSWGPWTTAFVQRLNELGWVEGRTVATSIAGRMDAASALLRLPPSSSGSRSTSS